MGPTPFYGATVEKKPKSLSGDMNNNENNVGSAWGQALGDLFSGPIINSSNL